MWMLWTRINSDGAEVVHLCLNGWLSVVIIIDLNSKQLSGCLRSWDDANDEVSTRRDVASILKCDHLELRNQQVDRKWNTLPWNAASNDLWLELAITASKLTSPSSSYLFTAVTIDSLSFFSARNKGILFFSSESMQTLNPLNPSWAALSSELEKALCLPALLDGQKQRFSNIFIVQNLGWTHIKPQKISYPWLTYGKHLCHWFNTES